MLWKARQEDGLLGKSILIEVYNENVIFRLKDKNIKKSGILFTTFFL